MILFFYGFFLRFFLFCGGLGFFVGGGEMIWIEDLFVMKSWIYSNIYIFYIEKKMVSITYHK